MPVRCLMLATRSLFERKSLSTTRKSISFYHQPMVVTFIESGFFGKVLTVFLLKNAAILESRQRIWLFQSCCCSICVDINASQ